MSRSRRAASLMLWFAAPLAMSTVAGATTLEQAIASAIGHAPEITIADAEADAAGARLDQARSGRMPTATLTGTIGYGRLNPQNFFGLGAANVTPRAAQATIEQPLFSGGRVSAGIDQARAGVAGASALKASTRSQLVTAVVAAYGEVLASARMVDLFDRLVSETTEIEHQARRRYRAGESPNTDVAQATARLAEARAGLSRAQGTQVSAQAHFNNLTGLDPTNLEPLPANPELPATLEDAMDAATRGNPLLAQAEAALHAAQAAARGARAERLPVIGAFAEASTVRDQFFPDYRADSTTVGVRARWQLFSGGRISGKIAEAGSEERAADARLWAARMQVGEQIVSAFQEVHTTLLVEQAASDQTTAAGEALESVRHEVRVGLKPQLDLLDAEREAIGAQSSLARAHIDRSVAAYRLLSLLGQH
ncbi:outer membrane protein [Sphingomonas sp. YR710]|uniref:TolC family protein n=1 Tax=Sphingomonas sp. YR710 TaxID=1882773 RepID=UPI000883333A|nr:TolC family protein [Sphingomonas sp. YR710]SDD81182.1 outer membrane protein [Sphingomonas sp. YR710]